MTKTGGYRPTSELAGITTFVSIRSRKGLPGATSLPEGDPAAYPQSALPYDEAQKEDRITKVGPTTYSTPDETTGIADKPRTLGKPGEEYGTPSKTPPHGTLGPRRTMTAEDEEEEVEETEDEEDFDEKAAIRMRPVRRQVRQKGKSKFKAQRSYRKNKSVLKQKARKRHRLKRNKPSYKRQKAVYRKNRGRFKRRRAEALMTFILPGEPDVGVLEDVSPETYRVSAWHGEDYHTYPLTRFLEEVVFLTEAGMERAFELFDQQVEGPLDKEASYVRYEVEPQDQTWGTWKSKHAPSGLPTEDSPRSPGLTKRRYAPGLEVPDEAPKFQHGLDISPTRGAPGSSRVVPYDVDSEFESRKAARIAEIIKGLSKQVTSKRGTVALKLQVYDPSEVKWTFKTKTGHTVTIKSDRVQNLKRAHMLVSCSCPFWVWQGPEHWAKKGKYLLGDPRGTASRPDVKDPDGTHRICKHTFAALDWVRQKSKK